MARYPVVTGAQTNNPMSVIVDTGGRAMGVTLQNLSAQDWYWSTDPSILQKADAANLPTSGHLMQGGLSPAPIVVLPSFKGKIYARAQNNGAAAETSIYENC